MKSIVHLLFFLLLASCASFQAHPPSVEPVVYAPRETGTLFSRFAPVYMVENPVAAYNRIGVPHASVDNRNRQYVFVDPATSAFFVEERKFTTGKGSYTNLIYRIHFPETPPDIIPFRLGAGKNVGILVIITLDSLLHPVLYTTVQTCGCYLAFIPTTYLAKENFPEKWPEESQVIFGIKLPAVLDVDDLDPDTERIAFLLRDGSHRVGGVFRTGRAEMERYEIVRAELSPADDLEKIPVTGGGVTSFFQESGSQQGYVKNNTKFRERVLMSWWAFDWRIGEDKRLGKNKEDPPVFYTSLKPWARARSDLRDFREFLFYWGWKL